MISLGAKITRAILRLYTYPYRKNHKSLSRSIKFDSKPYRHNYRYVVKNIGETNIEILSPTKCENDSCAIVNFHGGGHTQGMNTMYRKAAERLCDISGCSVYSIDYRTGRDIVYPQTHNECYAAYVGLIDSLLKEKQIIVVGDSFGTNLMLSTCLKLRDNGLALPSAIIAISCYIDMAASGVSYKDNCYKDPMYGLPKNQIFENNEKYIRRKSPYCGATSPYDIYLSPAYAQYDNFPDMLIQCGELETSRSDNETLYKSALNAGVNAKLSNYEGMWHDFQYITPFLKESKKAWKEIEFFILRFLCQN